VSPARARASQGFPVFTLHEGAPLVHLVTHAGDTGRKNVGRLYFEWLAPSPSPSPVNEP
jgi:hypothetical protein